MRGRVYFDSRKRVYSVIIGGKVKLKPRSIVLRDARFVTNKTGIQRIRKTGRKTVVATIVGDICIPTNPEYWPTTKVRFNPYHMDTFQLVDGTPILEAAEVHLTPRGVFV